ncbi:MAG: alkaline phosphatase [Desulfobacteraceae bacterium]|nr:MAG: alkaline phosphatase [Desulfobacteraceae bacterium]
MLLRFKRSIVVSLVVLGLSLLMVQSAWSYGHGDTKYSGFKNVIIMIPDGCDETVQTVARWYKGEDLQVDKMDGGGVKVHMANSVIPGSAAAATAFATGHKTTVRFLGVGPRTTDLLTGFTPTAEPYAPVASVIEAAKAAGKSTGIVSTSRVTHATPAAFACHIQDRGMDNEIMEHMVYNNINVVFGGGARHLIPSGNTYTTTFGAEWGGKRTDGEDLMQVLLDRGYRFVDNKDDMAELTSGNVWGLFDDSHMQPDMDRQHFATHEPSLAEMTSKAIELLAQNDNGFCLMVEGSQVDWAGHANDPVYMTRDFIAFDDAVKAACDFADQNPGTLVLAYPDHNTGGMKIGHYYTAMGYTETTIEDLVDPLKGMTITAGGLTRMMGSDTSVANIIATISLYWNIVIDETEAQEILDYDEETGAGLSYSISHVISKNHTAIGWTTHGHNGETVPLWVYGADAPAGIIDNTELALMAADAIGVDLAATTSDLYVDAATAITGTFQLDKTDPENPVLKAGVSEIPMSKDTMKFTGWDWEIELPGLAVYAPETDTVYISEKAAWIINLFN